MTEATPRRWRPLLWIVPAALVLLVLGWLAARALRAAPELAGFFAAYPGEIELPAWAATGFPAFVGWQHFLTSFFLVFIVASGLRIRAKERPPAFVTRTNTGRIRTKGAPTRLGLHTWWHIVVDTLFVLNGVVFVVLLFASGHWVRLVPLSWEVFPNAVSVGIQYLSLDWPTHNSWLNYNSLQQLSYFATVFLAGPLALVTGLRLSPSWPKAWARPSGVLGDRFARTTHFVVLWYFIVFTVFHVGLVFATGALRNLNHLYADRDDDSLVGLGIFAASLVVIVVSFVLLRPARQVAIAKKVGHNVREMPAAPKR